jgi:hypothetical protein
MALGGLLVAAVILSPESLSAVRAVLAAAFVRIFLMQSPGWVQIGRTLLRPFL